MKKLLPIGLIALISFSAAAIPAKKGVRTYTQADGTTISLSLVGDENFHSLVTTDGLTVSKGEDGNFYYRTANGISNIVAHNQEVRSASETSFIKANMAEMNMQTVAKAVKATGTMQKAPQRVMRRATQVPVSGSPKIPILLVQYKDVKFIDSDPKATFESFFAHGSTSAYQYFVDQSNGKYTPEFDVYGPVTLSKNRVSYGGNDSYYNEDKGVGAMVGEACSLLDSSVDFSQYDNNGDGECDVVIVLYAGVGEASSDVEDSVWPCQWQLSASDYGKSLTLDNTKVDKFAVFNELLGSDPSKVDGIGCFCHEFSHCLGLPDFYDTNYGNHFGMANWSLMDYGSYNNDGYTPIGYSAYEKEFMGWIDIDEYEEGSQYTLPVFNQKNIETDKAVKITNDKDPNEYYILENRANQGWDEYMPAEGLMISHVTYKASSWSGNVVNNYDTQLMTIIPADNDLKMDAESYWGYTYYSINEESLKGDLWPYGNATELTNTSKPAATVNTGTYMNKPVTEITKNADGTVSFWVMKGAIPSVATPINVTHNVESNTSATISWEAGDESDVTYTVEVSKYQEPTYELVSSTDFTTSHNWSEGGSVNRSNNELYIGSSKRTGSLTSPSFTTDETGTVTVIFYAKYYDAGSSIKVSLLNSSSTTLDSETIELTEGYEQYCVVLNGMANSSVSVCFESTASKQRVYLREADIYTGDASAVVNNGRARAASETLTFSGITETHLLLENLEENETYTYRVKAVPTDTKSYSESKWSEKQQFSLSDYNAVSNIAVDTNAAASYYTLSGIRISGAPTAPGIYIRRTGTQTIKVMVK